VTARSVTSNQIDIYKNLEAVVRKYAATTFLRPVADHTREAFERACDFVRGFNAADCAELVLDSGCGTGESTIHLARKFPNVPVIGVDKSAERLTKAGNDHQLKQAVAGCQELPPNVFWVRAELLDFWRLAFEKVDAGEWKILHHALYYPNPWPKESEATRRFHLHPIFPTLLRLSPVTELRTNWEIYAREFKEATCTLGGVLSLKLDVEFGAFNPENPETAFERKYKEARQQLWRTLVKA
jgi:tRNA G46 methylase TrmB